MVTLDDTAGDELPSELFLRQDNQPDHLFYQQPRLVTHIDDATIAALTEFYREFLPAGCDLIDLMSSWISHLPEELPLGEVIGHGMNGEELSANPRLSRFVVQDLNENQQLPFESESVDRACIVVSIQYLTQPVSVLKELHRMLRAGGALCIAMSHRCFPTKAILAFHQLNRDDRIALVGEYAARAGFTDIQFIDRSPPHADPLWLITAKKTAGA